MLVRTVAIVVARCLQLDTLVDVDVTELSPQTGWTLTVEGTNRIGAHSSVDATSKCVAFVDVITARDTCEV